VKLTKIALNRTYERMGLREALAMNLDLDTIRRDLDAARFDRIRDEQGLKAAIAWRDARFRAG
jgi:enoyl-CoA hydratase